MALDAIVNFGKVIVSTVYTSGSTSIVLSSGQGAKLPQPSTDGAFNLVWWNSTNYSDPADDPYVEIVRCTARSTDTLTVTRAQEGTTATNKNTASVVYKMALCLTKKMITDINALVSAHEALSALAGHAAGIGAHTHLSAGAQGGLLNLFGAWDATKVKTTVYTAATDGFVCALSVTGDPDLRGYTDSSNPPTTLRAHLGYIDSGTLFGGSIIFPVRKGDYWKVTAASGVTVTVYWFPIGG
jgi:hypothetical protein